MSMKLDQVDLAEIGAALEKVAALGLVVESFYTAGHKVMLGWDTGHPRIVGITQGEWSSGKPGHGGGVMRSADKGSAGAQGLPKLPSGPALGQASGSYFSGNRRAGE